MSYNWMYFSFTGRWALARGREGVMGGGGGGLTSRGLRSIGLVQNYRNSLISLCIVLRLSSYEALS